MNPRQLYRRITKGYIYDLQEEIIEFTIPKLKQFAKNCCYGYPIDLNSNEDWQGVLALMIHGMELFLTEYERELTEAEQEISRVGLDLFKEYFGSLWI